MPTPTPGGEPTPTPAEPTVPDLPELSTTPVEVAEAAEANRVRQALEQIGIDLSSLPTDAPTDGGEPIEFIVVDGGI